MGRVRRDNDRAERTAAMLRARRSIGLRSRRRRLPKQQFPPKTIQREYTKAIQELVAEARRIIEDELPGDRLERLVEASRAQRQDAGEAELARKALERARARMEDAITPRRVRELARKFAARTSTFQRLQLNKQVRAGLGAEVLIPEGRLAQILDGFVTENVSLIKDIPNDAASRIERIVTRGIADATPHPKVAEQIEETWGIERRRARLIARDQVGKLYGQANATRQKALGVDAFIWRDVSDRRVRRAHQALDGRRFLYSDPPAEGLPGTPVNCRCYAEPDLSGILERAR